MGVGSLGEGFVDGNKFKRDQHLDDTEAVGQMRLEGRT